MATVYLSLGSNLGDRHQHIEEAVRLLQSEGGEVTARSSFYETAPWGFVSHHRFLNVAVALVTALSPMDLLRLTQSIEKELGRLTKSEHGTYQDRVIDIDLLLYDELIMQSEELTLPHPRMHLRLFVLEPLDEIAPSLVHPLLGCPMKSLIRQLLQDVEGCEISHVYRCK